MTTNRMTKRERREARADRLEGWADKRIVKGEAAIAKSKATAALIPFGQPILAGHHSQRRDTNTRQRIMDGYDRGITDLDKAREMDSKAENIRAATANSIFSDDTDAIERLTAKIAALIVERDAIKAFNASCKTTPGGDLSLLSESQLAGYRSVVKHTPYTLGKQGQFPGYALSNLSATLRKAQQRLEALS